jgi:MFS family permease
VTPSRPADGPRAFAAPAAAADTAADAASITSPFALMLLAFVEAIKATGGTLATASLADASRELVLSGAQRAFAASAVSLAVAATAVAAGVAADRLGRRRLLMVSYVLAGLANLAIFLFPVGPVYVAGLFVAGLGYSIMLTSSFAYTRAVAPGRSLGLGLGLVGMFTTLFVMVTSIGGGALDFMHWHWLFLVVPVMCAVSFLLTPRLLPVMPRTGSGPVDVAGLVLLGAAMVGFISGVSRVTAHPPDRRGWVLVLAGVGLFVAWAVVERRRRAPSFPVRVFRSRPFVACVILGLTVPIVTAAMALCINDAIQLGRGSSAFWATLAVEPFFIAGGIGGLFAGRLLAKVGAERRIMTLTPLVVAAACASLALPDSGSSLWLFLPGIVVIGGAVGAVLTAQGQVIIQAVTKEGYGAVTAARTTIAQLGSALGMVLTMLVVKLFTGLDAWRALSAQGVTSAEVRATLDSIENAAGLRDYPEVVPQLLRSLTAGLHAAMLACACLMAGTALAVWLLLRERKGRRTAP